METVTFFELEESYDPLLKYAVVYARFQGRWIFVRHRDRTTWEMPGGHREPGETIDDAARRELYEETGTRDCQLWPVAVYSVTSGAYEAYGKLYFAEVLRQAPLPASEIAETGLFDALPGGLTYPGIQPHLHQRIEGFLMNEQRHELGGSR